MDYSKLLIVLFICSFSCKTPETTVITFDQKSNKNEAVERSGIVIKKDTVESLSGLYDIEYFDATTGELLFIHKNYNSMNLHINFVEIYNTTPTVLQQLPPNTHYIVR